MANTQEFPGEEQREREFWEIVSDRQKNRTRVRCFIINMPQISDIISQADFNANRDLCAMVLWYSLTVGEQLDTHWALVDR